MNDAYPWSAVIQQEYRRWWAECCGEEEHECQVASPARRAEDWVASGDRMHADQRYLYFPSADEEFCFFAEIVEWDTDSEEVVVERYLTGGGDRSELMSLPLVWPVRRINAAQFMNARRNGWGAMREWYLRFSFNNSSTEYAVVECTAPLSYTGDVLVYAADCREGTWQVIPQEEASRIDIIDLQAFQEALESLGIAKAPPRSSA